MAAIFVSLGERRVTLTEDVLDQLETIRDVVRLGITQFNQAGLFFGHGTESALDESTQLVLHALALPHDLPGHFMDARLLASEKQTILELFSRRIGERKPSAYLTNEAWFAGLKFYVDERVLVPRSPIGEMIKNQFSPWIDSSSVRSVLDLATGSGCIGIGCAYAFPEATVDLVDISADALAVAERNRSELGVADRVEIIQSDLFGELSGRQYDLIVTNPPYVDAGEMAALAPEYRHEPALGLAAGEDGLDIIRIILRRAADFLTEDGVLVAEVGASQYALEQAFPKVPFTWVAFENGGDGVFVLTREQLLASASYFR